jgi:integral membrane protein
MIAFFKKVAFWEGISLLLLLFFAMPMKYMFHEPIYVKVIGMAHGVLFLLYVGLALWLFFKDDWKISKLLVILFASLVPCGTFYTERKYFK